MRNYPQSYSPEVLTPAIVADYYTSTRRAWMSMAARFVGRERAEDAVQSAFVRILESLESYDGKRSLHAWIGTIVANVCRDILRRWKIRRADSLDATTETGDTLAALLPGGEGIASEANDSVRRIHEILDSLPPESSEILRMQMSGMSEADIAATLGIPCGTVKSRISTARKRFAEIWNK